MQVGTGKSVLNGIAIGKLKIYKKKDTAISTAPVADTAAELERFEAARQKAIEQQTALYEKALAEAGEDIAEVFNIHAMMLDDDDFVDAIKEIINGQKMCAEYAVKTAGNNQAAVFAAMDDPYLQARSADVLDIAQAMLDILQGVDNASLQGTEPSILVAEDLAPSETVRMDKSLLLGAEVIYEGMYDVHVSGHACQEEQKLMLTLTKPKYFLPVHGEYKQLKKHAMTAASLGIPTSNILIAENGSNVILSRDEIKLGEPVTAGAVMVDGLGVGDVGNVVLRDRKHLSEDGLVIIVATVDSKTGQVLAGPDLVSRGFVYVRENESLMDGAQSIVESALDRCVEEHVRDWNSVKTRVREALSSYIYRRTKRSPMILPILMEV